MIPDIVYYQKYDSTRSKDICPICLDDIMNTDALAHTEKGKDHPLHRICALNASLASNLCPCCRVPINTYNLFYRERRIKELKWVGKDTLIGLFYGLMVLTQYIFGSKAVDFLTEIAKLIGIRSPINSFATNAISIVVIVLMSSVAIKFLKLYIEKNGYEDFMAFFASMIAGYPAGIGFIYLLENRKTEAMTLKTTFTFYATIWVALFVLGAVSGGAFSRYRRRNQEFLPRPIGRSI